MSMITKEAGPQLLVQSFLHCVVKYRGAMSDVWGM
jgi:hypothetical protein